MDFILKLHVFYFEIARYFKSCYFNQAFELLIIEYGGIYCNNDLLPSFTITCTLCQRDISPLMSWML